MENPKELRNRAGGRVVIVHTSVETDGQLLEMKATYPPQSKQPPNHYHPFQEEEFEVLEGRFRTNIDGVERVFAVGETFTVPMNTHHWMHNISETEGKLLWKVRPALNTQAFFETMWGLDAEGKTNDQGLPNLLQLAVILRAYADEFRVSSPPYAVQRVLFAILASIGRLLGYQARYDRFSGKLGEGQRN